MPSISFFLRAPLACLPALLVACANDHQHEHHQHDGAVAVDRGPDAGAPDLGPAGVNVQSTRGRLLVADGDPENPRVMILDLDDGSVAAEFPTLGTARAYSTEPGSGYAYAVQGIPGLVEIFSSGISSVAGGTFTKRAPTPLETRLEGPRPTHWVSHDHWVVSFNDGDGSFDYLLEPTLGSSRILKRRATTGIAHHGVAVITHGNVIASHAIADPAGAQRTGVTVRKLAAPDVVVETVPGCPALHGEAANDRWVAFGCADGVLLGEWSAGKLTFRKLLHPEGKAVGTLRSGDRLPLLIANNRDLAKGHDVGFLLVTPTAEGATWAAVDIGVRQLAFLLEPAGDRLVTLGVDGQLRIHDALTGALAGAPVPAIEPYLTGPVPGLALGAGVAFVLDARAGKVVEVDLRGVEPSRVFQVGGQPVSAAAFGRTMSGRP